jgi:hypothetical protein
MTLRYDRGKGKEEMGWRMKIQNKLLSPSFNGLVHW